MYQKSVWQKVRFGPKRCSPKRVGPENENWKTSSIFNCPSKCLFSSFWSSQSKKCILELKFRLFKKFTKFFLGGLMVEKHPARGPGGALEPLWTIQDGLGAFWDKFKKSCLKHHFTSFLQPNFWTEWFWLAMKRRLTHFEKMSLPRWFWFWVVFCFEKKVFCLKNRLKQTLFLR